MESNVPTRFSSVSDFLASWFGPPVALPVTSASLPDWIPAELAEWHSIASRWGAERVATHNHPVALESLNAASGDMIVFWEEHQGCWEWAFRFEQPAKSDPAVFESEPGGEHESWLDTGQSLSQFLLDAAIFEALQLLEYSAHAPLVSETQAAAITSTLRKLDIAMGRRYLGTSEFYGGSGVLVEVDPPLIAGADSRRLTVAARNSKDLTAFIQRHSEVEWDLWSNTERQATSELPPW
jgi:hypothetical protein